MRHERQIASVSLICPFRRQNHGVARNAASSLIVIGRLWWAMRAFDPVEPAGYEAAQASPWISL